MAIQDKFICRNAHHLIYAWEKQSQNSIPLIPLKKWTSYVDPYPCGLAVHSCRLIALKINPSPLNTLRLHKVRWYLGMFHKPRQRRFFGASQSWRHAVYDNSCCHYCCVPSGILVPCRLQHSRSHGGGGAACTFCRAIHGICINLMRTFCETAWRNNKLYYGRLYCRPTAVLDGVKWLFQLVIMHANAQISTLKFSPLSPKDCKPIHGCDNRCVLVCERLTHKHAPVVTPMYSL